MVERGAVDSCAAGSSPALPATCGRVAQKVERSSRKAEGAASRLAPNSAPRSLILVKRRCEAPKAGGSKCSLDTTHGGVTQLAEHRIRNPVAAGSTPAAATTTFGQERARNTIPLYRVTTIKKPCLATSCAIGLSARRAPAGASPGRRSARRPEQAYSRYISGRSTPPPGSKRGRYGSQRSGSTH